MHTHLKRPKFRIANNVLRHVVPFLLAVTIGCSEDKPQQLENADAYLDVEVDRIKGVRGVDFLTSEVANWADNTLVDPSDKTGAERELNTECHRLWFKEDNTTPYLVQVICHDRSKNNDIPVSGYLLDGLVYNNVQYNDWFQFSANSGIRDLAEANFRWLYLLAVDYLKASDIGLAGTDLFAVKLSDVYLGLTTEVDNSNQCLAFGSWPNSAVPVKTLNDLAIGGRRFLPGLTWSPNGQIEGGVAHELNHALGARHIDAPSGDICHHSDEGNEVCKCVGRFEDEITAMFSAESAVSGNQMEGTFCVCSKHRRQMRTTCPFSKFPRTPLIPRPVN